MINNTVMVLVVAFVTIIFDVNRDNIKVTKAPLTTTLKC